MFCRISYVICTWLLLSFSLARALADGPVTDASQRLTTRQLEDYLWQRVYGDQKFEWTIDNFSAAQHLNIQPRDGATIAQELENSGGFFGLTVETPIGPLRVDDNKASYLWSHNMSQLRSAASPAIDLNHREGHRLSPDKAFAHIIPQRAGIDQPEMVKFLKEGDIAVYWHPENRKAEMGTLQQWRCTHGALIIERQISETAADGSVVTKTVLSTCDTPSGYAKPFNGSSTTPFHVFRFMPRDEDGNALPNETARAYRAQAARWGTLMFKKAEFNGDYNSMTLRLPEDIIDDAKTYLGVGQPQRKYCAWLAYSGWCLGWMTPINARGLPEDLFGTVAFKHLSAGTARLDFRSDQHRYGDGSLADCAAPENLVAHRDEFPFPPTTAPELAINFLDRALGPDENYTSSPEIWGKHVTFKHANLVKLKEPLLETFVVDVETPDDNRGFDPYRRPAAEIAEYNARVGKVFDQVIDFYAQAGNLGSLTASELPAGMSPAQAMEQKGRTIISNLVYEARAISSRGKKWLPPYAFFREAEAFDQYFQSKKTRPYVPRAVYVGTVIPIQFLKKLTDSDRSHLFPLAARGETAWDGQYYGDDIIRTKLAVADANSNAVDALWQKLGQEGDKTGFNEYEKLALEVVRNAWIPQAELPAEADMGTPQWQVRIAAHNKYGIDPVLFRRVLVEYWNDPKSLRPAIYDGDIVSVASAAENIRLLFSHTDQSEFSEMKSLELHMQNDANGDLGHPRRVRPLPCGGGLATIPTSDQPNCSATPVPSDPEVVVNPNPPNPNPVTPDPPNPNPPRPDEKSGSSFFDSFYQRNRR